MIASSRKASGDTPSVADQGPCSPRSLVEHAPEEYRESMLKNVRLNREIESAWKALHPERAAGESKGMEAWAEHGEPALRERGESKGAVDPEDSE